MDLSALEYQQNSNGQVNQTLIFNNGIINPQVTPNNHQAMSLAFNDGMKSRSLCHQNHSSTKRSPQPNHHNSTSGPARVTVGITSSHSRSLASPPLRTLLPADSRPLTSGAGSSVASTHAARAPPSSILPNSSPCKLPIQRLLSHQTTPATAILQRLHSHPASSAGSGSCAAAGSGPGTVPGARVGSGSGAAGKCLSGGSPRPVRPRSTVSGAPNSNTGTNSYSITISNQRKLRAYYVFLSAFKIHSSDFNHFNNLHLYFERIHLYFVKLLIPIS